MADQRYFEDYVLWLRQNLEAKAAYDDIERELDTLSAQDPPDQDAVAALRKRLSAAKKLSDETFKNFEDTYANAWRTADGAIIMPSRNACDWHYEDGRLVPPEVVATKRRPV